MLKNALNIFISTKYNKNKILTDIILNIIYYSNKTRLVNLINLEFSILNIKLANLAIFLLNKIQILN